MAVKHKKRIFLLVTFVLLVVGVFGFMRYYNNTKIERVLKTESYAYLPKAAQNYIKEIYEETGKIVLTEKNKEENQPYLNPEYVKYLENGEASEYGYIPEEFIVDHSYKNDVIIEKHGVDGEETAEELSYYNLRDEGYITNIYDQGSEGLCWAFASSTSLESHLAKKSNKQTMLTFSEKQVDYATTLNEALDVGSNPYITKYTTILGQYLNEGGNMLRFANSTAIGISPVECRGNCSNGVDYNENNNIIDNKYWKYDYSVNSSLSPYEVLNFDNTQYSLNESLFFNPLVNEDEDEVNALVEILKNQIVNNGSLYVGVGAYTNLSVEYTPTDGEQTLNANGKNIIYYIPYGWNPENALNHAVSIIGWDDNYTHNICLDKTAFEITDAIKNADDSYTCSSSTASVHTIKGAWILQNSWGAEKDTYIYLPYNTMKSSYSSITDVGEIDFDNSYRSTGWRTYIDKGDTKEVVSKVKLFISSYNQTIKVYYDESDNDIIINDGSESSYGTLLATLNTTHPGLYTIDLLDKNIILDESISRAMFSFDTDDTDYYYYASVHTNNVEEDDKYIDINKISKTDEEILAKCNLNDNKCISTPQQISFDDNNVFVISGVTRSLTSDDNLTFKVLNSDKEDVTNLFHFFRNFSVSNYINALISYNDDNVELGTYTIEVYYNGVKYDELEWELENHNNIIDGIGTEQNPHRIKNIEDLNDIRNHTTTNSKVEDVIYGYYVLENDLDLTYDTQDKNGLFYNSGAGWDPIYKFAGNFEGNNYAIEGLYINRPSTENNVGLFGTVFGFDNYIRNIILKNVNIKGNSDVGALIGGIYESRGIELHDIAIINGKILSSSHVIGSIVGVMRVQEDSEYNFYNLFNNATVGNSNANFTGGFIGYIERTDPYDQVFNVTISDSANLGNVYGGAGKTGGIIAEVAGANELTFKNIISVGTYKNGKTGVIGDIFGSLYNNSSLNMTNIKYLTRLYGSSLELGGEYTIENNTIVAFKNIISFDYISTFEHNGDWINPVVDNIKRIPMLKSMVNYFDFTEKINDFEMGLTTTINIEDIIKPDIDAVKNIKYTYDEEYLTISSSGEITPNKIGTTTIKIDSLYDGYSDEIQITIKDTTNIVYNSNNEANESVNQQVYLGTSVNLDKNTFEYKGHIFKNWNTKADGTGDTYTDEQLIEEGINEELQLYAQWTPIQYTIYYNANGGEGETRSWELDYPESGKVLFGGSSWFTKENYVFDSWNTKADGSGIKYLSLLKDYSITFDEIPFDENYEITVYAQWKKVEYSIWLDSNGGLQSQIELKYAFDETKALSLNIFTKTGYTFKNWNTKADGSGDTYTDGQIISTDKNMRLYAQWSPNEQIVSYDANGGTGTMDNQKYYYNVSQEINENLFEREHYTFKNWNTKADGTGTSYNDKQSIKVTDNITLYAQWSPREYVITFDANGGAGTMDNQSIVYDVETELNDVKFDRDGYIFKNWNTKANGTGTSYADKQSIKVTENITLYAQWEEGLGYVINKYTVDESKKYIDKIDINTTEDTFKSNIELNTGYSLEVASKTINGNNLLYTGSKTKIFKNNNLVIEYTNIIRGEVTGDGKINYLDYVNVYNHIQKVKFPELTKKELKNEYLISADMSGDGKVNYLDYVKIYNKIKELKGGN